MPDLKQPEDTGLNRKRSATSLDADSQQPNNDDNVCIDLTPSHIVPERLGLTATGSVPTASAGKPQHFPLPARPPGVNLSHAGSKPSPTPSSQSLIISYQPFKIPARPSGSNSSKQSIAAANPQFQRQSASASQSGSSQKATLAPEDKSSKETNLESKPQSSKLPTASTNHYSKPEPDAPRAESQLDNPNDEGRAVKKWNRMEYDEDRFDSDAQDMSLTVVMKLAHQLSLLKEFLETYKNFNVHLGSLASGPRHEGLLRNIFSTGDRLKSYTTHLHNLREEKQRGTQDPGRMELVAMKICRKFKAREDDVWDLIDEKVDMANDADRAAWLEKKKNVLQDVMGWTLNYLEKLDQEVGWKEAEVGNLKHSWEQRWKTYASMNKKDLRDAGWILDVGN